MRRRLSRFRSQSRADPFTDLLFNALLGFTFLFLIALMFINPQARKGRVDLKAEYIISITWPDDLPDDVDLWVRDPLGNVVSYLQKDAGWLHLDRDDRGEINDTILVDGREVTYPINQEVVTIRGIVQGEYVVNVYYYTASHTRPFDTLVKIERVNPTLQTVFVKKVPMLEQDQEVTVARFQLDTDGRLHDISDLPVVLTPYALDKMPADPAPPL